jgi:hypothetical protein
MDDGTASYTMNQDWMKIKFDGFGALVARKELERAMLRYKSVLRNDKDFMEKKKKGATPDLYK